MVMTRKYYLEDELFPRRGAIAQVPHLYGREHNELLNRIVKYGVRGTDNLGRVFYTVREPPRWYAWLWGLMRRFWR